MIITPCSMACSSVLWATPFLSHHVLGRVILIDDPPDTVALTVFNMGMIKRRTLSYLIFSIYYIEHYYFGSLI